MNREYIAIWKLIAGFKPEDLQKAYEFYMRSPDGQYDTIAATCIRAVILQRAKDLR